MAIKGLSAWVEKLGKREMPVLATIVQELNQLTGSDDTEVNQLADVILKDANLTSQVLRIANSVHYNPSSYPINTVSRAIVLIGFSGVKVICLSVMIIDTLLGKEPREHLLQQMAQAFHAAVQAKRIVRKTNDAVQEEVFIAALLYHLGEMSFWACGGKSADELGTLLQSGKATLREASEQVLGCSFKGITRSLANVWKLGDTLEQSLYPGDKPSPKVVAVCLAEQLSRTASHGWDSPEALDVIKKIARFTGQSLPDTQKSVLDGADEAASVALTYGAAKVCHLIPSRQQHEARLMEVAGAKPLSSNPELQLSILRELSNATLEKLDVNAIFQMVLEGLHRGIGLERVALGFIQKDQIVAKYVLGEGTDNWREQFHFSLAAQEDNIFTHAIRLQEPQWLLRDGRKEDQHLYSPDIIRVLGKLPAFASVISLGGRNIAVFYADRWKLGGALEDEHFQSFRHFMMQAQMSLQMLAVSAKG